MSYDTYMVIDASPSWWRRRTVGSGEAGEQVVCEIGNMTSNVSGMWALALGRPLAELHGWSGADCIDELEYGIRRISDPDTRSTYERMAPSNGWGSVENAERYLWRILVACIRHPNATFKVDR